MIGVIKLNFRGEIITGDCIIQEGAIEGEGTQGLERMQGLEEKDEKRGHGDWKQKHRNM